MKYSNNLNDLLKEGLNIWIADYVVAKKHEQRYADIILEGINFYREKLNESDQRKLDQLIKEENLLITEEYDRTDIESSMRIIQEEINNEGELNESVIRRAIGAVGGFAIGPAIGKIIADTLGVERRGILYDFLTSRLVGTALGSAITKELG